MPRDLAPRDYFSPQFLKENAAEMATPLVLRPVKPIVQGKLASAQRIAEEESTSGRNDLYDAVRHARTSYRVAAEIDPLTSFLVGLAHEIRGSFGGQKVPQPLGEFVMDMRNNGVGIRSYKQRSGMPTAQSDDLVTIKPGSAYPTGR
jgi:hypothetical protein